MLLTVHEITITDELSASSLSSAILHGCCLLIKHPDLVCESLIIPRPSSREAPFMLSQVQADQ
jgi:hypothetical protein